MGAGLFRIIGRVSQIQRYAGIWPFRPDGNWRQVTWISDKNGARTIVSTATATIEGGTLTTAGSGAIGTLNVKEDE
jgi:hypothetical protein